MAEPVSAGPAAVIRLKSAFHSGGLRLGRVVVRSLQMKKGKDPEGNGLNCCGYIWISRLPFGGATIRTLE